jgi:hypothetical protein
MSHFYPKKMPLIYIVKRHNNKIKNEGKIKIKIIDPQLG